MPQNLVTSILSTGTIQLEWEGCVSIPEKSQTRLEKQILERFQESKNKCYLILSLSDKKIPLSPSLSFWRDFTSPFTQQLLLAPDLEEKRDKIKIPLEQKEIRETLAKAPSMVGLEILDEKLLLNTWDNLHAAFKSEIKRHKGSAEELLKSLVPDSHLIERIHFHLVENRNNDINPFAFLSTYSTRIDEKGLTKHLPLKFALKEYEDNRPKLLELLSTVKKVAAKSTFINNLLESGELFHPISFSSKDAYQFLNEVIEYEKAGILCRIPRWWKNTPRKISLGLSIGNNKPSKVGFDAILDFKAELYFDGKPISQKEALALIEQSDGLAFIKGKWVAVDPESLKSSMELLKKAQVLAKTQHLTLAEAMRLLMGSQTLSEDIPLEDIDLNCGEWLKSVLEKMRNPKLVRDIKPDKRLDSALRPYQQKGLNWLYFLHTLGFGSCLADDMGLGKTVQVLALLQVIKNREKDNQGVSLLVVPASLMANWEQEIKKFTPELNYAIIHPQSKTSLKKIRSELNKMDLAITTYGMLKRLEWLMEQLWFYIILDEAQAIKNSGTAQTKAVKLLKCTHRIIMTGTPVENRLSDLWSLFDFLNPGLLGSANQFKKYVKRLENNPEGYGKLRQVVHPYILRRLKTDKSIISDLPDKVEMKSFADLSKKQVVLYKKMLEEMQNQLAQSDEGIKRKGLILTYLMKFKQLCNHPDQYNGAGVFQEKDSGKFQRLREICETVYEKREKLLVFTQFKEIIEPLSLFLESVFRHPGLVMHGQTPVKKRKNIVQRFQANDYIPYLVLSLKVGGVGLNLTAANHVIHFDRWWNPAVENQATDRAFRIGQKKNVVVHKFICKGTVEDKIDRLIEDKKQLANEVLGGSSEMWITEMDDKQLMDMFTLNLNN